MSQMCCQVKNHWKQIKTNRRRLDYWIGTARRFPAPLVRRTSGFICAHTHSHTTYYCSKFVTSKYWLKLLHLCFSCVSNQHTHTHINITHFTYYSFFSNVWFEFQFFLTFHFIPFLLNLIGIFSRKKIDKMLIYLILNMYI